MTSDFKMFTMSKSPFHKERNLKGKTKNIAFRLPIEAYEDLKNYFEGVYGEDGALSKGFKDLSYETLDSVCLERKNYNNLNVFMLIPKTDDLDDLHCYSEIFAFIDIDNDIEDDFNVVSRFEDDYNILYNLVDFNEENVPMGIFAHSKEFCLYRLRKDRVCDSFNSLSVGLYSLYPHLTDWINKDLEFYMVRFPLNNYLDVFRNGQYQSLTYNNSHEGAFIFYDLVENRKIYSTIRWDYSPEGKHIFLDFLFYKPEDFSDVIYSVDDDKLTNVYRDIRDTDYRKDGLINFRERLIEDLKLVDEAIRKEFPDEYEKLDDVKL